jgi:broad specificity phosphatase PhoE
MIAVQARMVAALGRLSRERPDDELIKAALAHILATPLELLARFDVAPGSISTIEIRSDGGRGLGLNRSIES